MPFCYCTDAEYAFDVPESDECQTFGAAYTYMNERDVPELTEAEKEAAEAAAAATALAYEEEGLEPPTAAETLAAGLAAIPADFYDYDCATPWCTVCLNQSVIY